MNSAPAFAAQFSQHHDIVEGQILLNLDGYRIRVVSNSRALLETLGIYFAHVLDAGQADITVTAIEREPVDVGVDFVDWKREPGKTGRKDAFFDLKDGRLVKKVRTGMVFLQSDTHRFAVGPCQDNDNQVINFINAQYMNWLQHNGHLICHASGLVVHDTCLGIAGFSGGGKSTLMLQVLDQGGVGYLTNDRLFITKTDAGVRATGIPKLPRVNPGTIVHNERLRPLLSPHDQAHFLSMPPNDLWHVEDKYDVDVEDIYGEGTIVPKAALNSFLVLNWARDNDAPCTIAPIDLRQRPELLVHAIMKSPGPFYAFPDGTFLRDDMEHDPEPYLDVLSNTPVFEATGRIDFDFATHFCLDHMKG